MKLLACLLLGFVAAIDGKENFIYFTYSRDKTLLKKELYYNTYKYIDNKNVLFLTSFNNNFY